MKSESWFEEWATEFTQTNISFEEAIKHLKKIYTDGRRDQVGAIVARLVKCKCKIVLSETIFNKTDHYILLDDVISAIRAAGPENE